MLRSAFAAMPLTLLISIRKILLAKAWPLFMLALLCFAQGVQSAQSDLPGPRTGMATRSVANYLALERSLEESITAGDGDAVTRTLGDDFGARNAANRDELAGPDWLAAELKSPLKSAGVGNLTVREYKDIAVVSFILERRSLEQPKSAQTALFVVDIWQRTPNRLLSRYTSELPENFPLPKKPNIRE